MRLIWPDAFDLTSTMFTGSTTPVASAETTIVRLRTASVRITELSGFSFEQAAVASSPSATIRFLFTAILLGLAPAARAAAVRVHGIRDEVDGPGITARDRSATRCSPSRGGSDIACRSVRRGRG